MTKRTSYANPQGEITLTLRPWETNCGDGCCYDYGVDLYCNGKNLDIDLQYTNLEDAVKDVIKQVGLTSKGGSTVTIDFFSQTYDFKTKNAMNELLENFLAVEDLGERKLLWDSFIPVVEIFFLNLHCEELYKKNFEPPKEFIIVNEYLLPVVGSEEDDEFEIFDKLVEVLEILGFEVDIENDW